MNSHFPSGNDSGNDLHCIYSRQPFQIEEESDDELTDLDIQRQGNTEVNSNSFLNGIIGKRTAPSNGQIIITGIAGGTIGYLIGRLYTHISERPGQAKTVALITGLAAMVLSNWWYGKSLPPEAINENNIVKIQEQQNTILALQNEIEANRTNHNTLKIQHATHRNTCETIIARLQVELAAATRRQSAGTQQPPQQQQPQPQQPPQQQQPQPQQPPQQQQPQPQQPPQQQQAPLPQPQQQQQQQPLHTTRGATSATTPQATATTGATFLPLQFPVLTQTEPPYPLQNSQGYNNYSNFGRSNTAPFTAQYSLGSVVRPNFSNNQPLPSNDNFQRGFYNNQGYSHWNNSGVPFNTNPQRPSSENQSFNNQWHNPRVRSTLNHQGPFNGNYQEQNPY